MNPSYTWQPWPTRPLFLLFNFSLSLTLLVMIEVLLRLSQSRGGFATESRWLDWTPTVVAVAFGLAWAYVDQNIKRMEPWWQLSTAGSRGAEAADSVVLEYPYMFAPIVPWRAAKKRHWVVMLSAMALMVSNFVVVPLMGALFSYGSVQRSTQVSARLAAVRPLEDQKFALSPDFGYRAFDYVWNHTQVLPDFVTKGGEAAVVPLTPSQEGAWKTDHGVQYAARLECTEALRREERHPKKGYLQFVYLTVKDEQDGVECVLPVWEGFEPANLEKALTMDDNYQRTMNWWDRGLPDGKRVDISKMGRMVMGTNEVSWLKYRINNMYPYHAIWGDIRSQAGKQSIIKTAVDFDTELRGINASQLLQWNKIHLDETSCGERYSFLGIWNKRPLDLSEPDDPKDVSIEKKMAAASSVFQNIDYDPAEEEFSSVPLKQPELKISPLQRQFSIEHPQTWAPIHSDWTAVVCRPVYTQQRVKVEYNSTEPPGHRLRVLEPVGEREPLDSASIDTGVFETMISLGYTEFSSQAMNLNPPLDHQQRNVDWKDQWISGQRMTRIEPILEIEREWPFALPDHEAQLRVRSTGHGPNNLNVTYTNLLFNMSSIKYNTLSTPPRSLLPYGLARIYEDDLGQLNDPDNLAKMLNDSYALLFSLATNLHFFDNVGEYHSSNATAVAVDGQGSRNIAVEKLMFVNAYTVDELWARLMQAALAVLSVLIFGVIALLWSRHCLLTSDPGSILSSMATIANSPAILIELRGAEEIPAEELHKTLVKRGARYVLPGSIADTILRAEDETQKPLISVADELQLTPHQVRKDTPLEMNPYMASAVILGMLSLLSLAVVVYFVDKKNQGLNAPGVRVSDRIPHAILFSYLPTVVAMSLDAFFLMMSRFVGVVSPYADLYQGKSTSATPLLISYESTPPQLLLPEALKNKHWLLSITATTNIFSIILTISFAGLFRQTTEFMHIPGNLIGYDMGYDTGTFLNLSILEEYLDRPLLPSGPGGPIEIEYGGRTRSDGSMENDYGEQLNQDLYPPYNMGMQPNLDAFTSMFSVVSGSAPLSPFISNDSSHIYFHQYNPNPPPPHLQSLEGTLLGFSTNINCRVLDSSNASTSQVRISPEQIEVYQIDSTTRGVEADTHSFLMAPSSNQTDCDNTTMYERFLFRPLSFGVSTSTQKGDPRFLHMLQGTNRPSCRGVMKAAWLSFDGSIHTRPNNGGEILEPSQATPTPSFDYLSSPSLFLSCHTQLTVGEYAVTMSPRPSALGVTSHRLLRSLPTPPDDRNLQALFQTYLSTRNNAGFSSDITVRDTKPITWFSYFLHSRSPSTFDTWPPDPRAAIPALEDTYKLQFALFLHTFAKQLFPEEHSGIHAASDFSGLMTETRTRTQFGFWAASVGILAYFLLATATVYYRRPGRALPTLPTSLATTWALAGTDSHFITQDVAGGCEGLDAKQRVKWVRNEGGRFAFGNYRGVVDGGMRKGVEKLPWVSVPQEEKWAESWSSWSSKSSGGWGRKKI